MKIRLVATDLDGTLLDPVGRVAERTARAVMAARAAGIHVIPVTGRPPQGLWDIAARAGLGPFGVCSNGAATVDLDRNEIIETQTLARAIALRLAYAMRVASPGIRLAVDVADMFWYESGFFESAAAWDETVTEVSDITEILGPDCYKLVGRNPGVGAVELIAQLEEHVGEEGHLTTSGLDWVDVGAPGITKAYAMERVCDRLGVRLDEVVAIGDNHNDLPLLAWAGTAMAPANAIPEALALATRVLPANADHGVATLLEELVAGHPPTDLA
ncbi:MAG: Cof-type HAD-IIB family hydrolase [Actinomycetota bacterium]|nr:Cof-type HAD-IIB family hydrolase [Actinomycetota bacterium]